MFSVKVVKKKDMLDRIYRSVKKLDNQKTKVGYFSSQGFHIGADQTPYLKYPAMAQALETGVFGDMYRVPLPFMKHIGDVTRSRLAGKRSSHVNKQFKRWKKVLYRDANPSPLLDAVGEAALVASKEVFNNSKYFPQAPSNRSPVWESGEMRDKLSYKNTIDRKVKGR